MGVPDWNAVAAVASCAAVIVAAASAWFSWATLRAVDDPKVVLYVKHDDDRPTILLLVVDNIGRDTAEDVRFTFSRPLPAEAFGLPGSALPEPKEMKGPLTEGIPAIGPGAVRAVTWGQYAGLSAALKDGPIDVSYTYRKGRRRFGGATRLEVESFGYTDASETPAAKTAKAAAQLSKDVSTLTALAKDAARRRSKE